jgi:hypothetical protein
MFVSLFVSQFHPPFHPPLVFDPFDDAVLMGFALIAATPARINLHL